MALLCISTEGYTGSTTAQSTVHSLQRGAARSPTTLALSMLQALTRPLLAWRNHPCSPNLGKCQRASPDCIGGANCALAVPLLLSEDTAPMIVPMPTRAAPSSSCFIGGLLWVWVCFPGCTTEKASQLSLVRRPSVAVSKCTTGDLKLNPQRVL